MEGENQIPGREVASSAGSDAAASARNPPNALLVQAQFFHATPPVPSPEVAREWEELVPGSADRILTVFLDQARHRMDLERVVIPAEVARMRAGMWIGPFVFLIINGFATYLAMNGHATLAGMVFALATASGVATYAWGVRERRAERIEKAKLQGSNRQAGE